MALTLLLGVGSGQWAAIHSKLSNPAFGFAVNSNRDRKKPLEQRKPCRAKGKARGRWELHQPQNQGCGVGLHLQTLVGYLSASQLFTSNHTNVKHTYSETFETRGQNPNIQIIYKKDYIFNRMLSNTVKNDILKLSVKRKRHVLGKNSC